MRGRLELHRQRESYRGMCYRACLTKLGRQQYNEKAAIRMRKYRANLKQKIMNMSAEEKAEFLVEHEQKKKNLREYNRIKQQEHRDRLKNRKFVDSATSTSDLEQFYPKIVEHNNENDILGDSNDVTISDGDLYESDSDFEQQSPKEDTSIEDTSVSVEDDAMESSDSETVIPETPQKKMVVKLVNMRPKRANLMQEGEEKITKSTKKQIGEMKDEHLSKLIQNVIDSMEERISSQSSECYEEHNEQMLEVSFSSSADDVVLRSFTTSQVHNVSVQSAECEEAMQIADESVHSPKKKTAERCEKDAIDAVDAIVNKLITDVSQTKQTDLDELAASKRSDSDVHYNELMVDDGIASVVSSADDVVLGAVAASQVHNVSVQSAECEEAMQIADESVRSPEKKTAERCEKDAIDAM